MYHLTFSPELSASIRAKLNYHDLFVRLMLKMKAVRAERGRNEHVNSIIYWILIIFSYLSYLVSIYFYSPMFKAFAWQYLLMNFFIHYHSFEIFKYFQAVESRMKTLSETNFNCQSSCHDVKKAFVQINEVVDEINKRLKTSLLVNLFCLYGFVLDNLHWIGIAALGVPNVYVIGLLFSLFFNLYSVFFFLIFRWNYQRHSCSCCHLHDRSLRSSKSKMVFCYNSLIFIDKT